MKAVFEQQDVDPIAKLYADLHIALINTLQDLEILLGLGFRGYKCDSRDIPGPGDVGRVKHVVLLVAAPDALHVARVQKPAVVPQCLHLADEAVAPAAGFHQHNGAGHV